MKRWLASTTHRSKIQEHREPLSTLRAFTAAPTGPAIQLKNAGIRRQAQVGKVWCKDTIR